MSDLPLPMTPFIVKIQPLWLPKINLSQLINFNKLFTTLIWTFFPFEFLGQVLAFSVERTMHGVRFIGDRGRS